MEHDRILAFERVDRHAAQVALVDQTARGIQAREIVQHAGESCFAGVDTVDLRKHIRASRNADDVFVAVALSEVCANASCEVGKVQKRLRYTNRARSAESRAR